MLPLRDVARGGDGRLGEFTIKSLAIIKTAFVIKKSVGRAGRGDSLDGPRGRVQQSAGGLRSLATYDSASDEGSSASRVREVEGGDGMVSRAGV